MNKGTSKPRIHRGVPVRSAWTAAGPMLALSIFLLMASSTALAIPADHTFNVVVEAHCNSAVTVCGYNSEADFRNNAVQAMYDMSNYWRSTGISFNLKQVTFYYGDDYARIKDDALDAGEEADLALLNNLRAMAKDDPTSIYWFVIDDIGFCFSGIPGAALGRTPNPRMPDEYYGLFCSGVDGNTMAHEFGHHFCLDHPFSGAEPATYGDTPNHDGDGLTDTAPDPCCVDGSWDTDSQAAQDESDVVFTYPVSSGADPESCDKEINDNRDWCGYTMYGTDAGSFGWHYCAPNCRRSSGGSTYQTAYTPDMELIMSYYKGDCAGPFVYKFVPYEAFSQQQIDKVRACFESGVERGQLDDLCNGADADWDGICDPHDQCPYIHASINDTDKDGDHIPDACDACPDVVNIGVDTDGDGLDNACDTNDDGDACPDDVDDHPLESTLQVGTLQTPGCDTASHAVMASESNDSDSDGIPDCREPDNDNDGIDDALDPCPNLADSDLCVIPGEGCAITVPWATCLGGGCAMDIWARLESITHPDDPRLEFPARFHDESIFLLPSTGRTAGELRGAMTGATFGLVEGAEKIRMSLVDNATGAEVAEVGTFMIANATVMGGNLGNSLEVRFNGYQSPVAAADGLVNRADTTQYIKLKVGLTWGVGVPADEAMPDTDTDGVPDSVDNCTEVANASQDDIDGDRVGNACDPDYDDDGLVTETDLAKIDDCIGTSLVDLPQFIEPGQGGVRSENAAEARAMAVLCRMADIDGNGAVEVADRTIAGEYLGGAPGPSGMVATGEPVEPNPDVSPELVTGDVIGIDTAIGETVSPPDINFRDLNTGDETVAGDQVTGGGNDGCCQADTGVHGENGMPAAVLATIVACLLALAAARRRKSA